MEIGLFSEIVRVNIDLAKKESCSICMKWQDFLRPTSERDCFKDFDYKSPAYFQMLWSSMFCFLSFLTAFYHKITGLINLITVIIMY